MIINQATDYAFRAVLYLAKQPEGEVVEAQTISEHEVIPMRFLLKIMPSLIKAGIVKSFRGVGGGYALAKKPEDISLLSVLEAVEGSIRLNRCLVDNTLCSKQGAPHCRIHQAIEGIQTKLVQELAQYDFAQLMR